MRKLSHLFIVFFLLAASSAFAVPPAGVGNGNAFGHGQGINHGHRVYTTVPGNVPPGLSKHGKYPRGLIKQGKVPSGWSKGNKEGWNHDNWRQ